MWGFFVHRLTLSSTFNLYRKDIVTSPVAVRITRVGAHAEGLSLPAYATEGSAGMDLCAAVDGEFVLHAGETALILTGYAIALPAGYEAQVRPRSGLAIKHRIGIMNSPGTIDSDYRGEIKVILTNFGSGDFTIRRGDRIAQMIIAPYVRAEWKEESQLDETSRGAGGFGHTGLGGDGQKKS